MVEVITKYKVGGQIFDDPKEAERYEATNELISMIIPECSVIDLLVSCKTDEVLLEALARFCRATEYLHHKPINFFSLNSDARKIDAVVTQEDIEQFGPEFGTDDPNPMGEADLDDTQPDPLRELEMLFANPNRNSPERNEG